MKISSRIMIIVFLGLAVIFMSLYQPNYSYGVEYEVRVINGFRNNSSLALVIWCSSSDGDDLGGRALQEGDDFGWRFKTDFWATTHFMCTMKWDNIRKKFYAFKLSRDINRCSLFKKCSWLVTEDGFYFSNDEIIWKKDFSWL